MGMFDKPQYLTGDDGFVSAGDIFWLHNARIDGQVTINGVGKDQAKLLVSHEIDSERVAVFSSGAGIVNQVKRMESADRARMPFEVRLDQVPSKQGSPTYVLSPAADPAPSLDPGEQGEIPF